MKQIWIFIWTALFVAGCAQHNTQSPGFIRVEGQHLVTPDGKPFLPQGINLGNWLNPEGYMFLFQDVSSYRLINQAFSEMVGPDFVGQFWRTFQDNYITRDDIQYIRKTGMNSVRLPFHYKMFTNEDYMGHEANPQMGFARIDSLIGWCREAGLYVILDMHDAPGGQTGDNIDDSYGYPWLFYSAESQQKMIDIWQAIAKRYAHEPVVLGYDLLNEPIATFFPDLDAINPLLEPLYIRTVKAIRQYDTNHVVLLGGAQWNSNFKVFSQFNFDSNIMYTCHRYWSGTATADIQDFIDFRNKVNLPMYMGETGENTDEWVSEFRKTLEENQIGWHFWPYKKMGKASCMVSIAAPKNWDLLVQYTQAQRQNFNQIRQVRPDQELVKASLNELLENMQFGNCRINPGYIRALGMQP